MRLQLNEFLSILDEYYKTKKEILLVLDYNYCIKSMDAYKTGDVLKGLSYNDCKKLLSNTYNELDNINNRGGLYSFNCNSTHNYEDSICFEINAMKPVSCGGTGIFSMRIFVLDHELISTKINEFKSPYKERLFNIKNNIHPYRFIFNCIIREMNSDFLIFIRNICDENSDDLSYHMIDMDEFKDILLNNMKESDLFSDIIEDFQIDISSNKKKMSINNSITGFDYEIKQYEVTNYYCDYE